jgi:G3E family GTPase
VCGVRLRAHFKLDAIVTLVDAQNVRQQLAAGAQSKASHESRDIGIEIINEAEEQIALAGNAFHRLWHHHNTLTERFVQRTDRILLNKVDLVSAKELNEVEKLVRGINPSAPITRTEYSKVDAATILNIGAFDIEKTLARDEGFLNFRYRHSCARGIRMGDGADARVRTDRIDSTTPAFSR